MIASARSTAQLVQTARQGAGVPGPGTPAAAGLENIALAIASLHGMHRDTHTIAYQWLPSSLVH
jgi:hypothetical protein